MSRESFGRCCGVLLFLSAAACSPPSIGPHAPAGPTGSADSADSGSTNNSSPCGCPNNYAAVCGVDGITYNNQCQETCAGVRQRYVGPCSGAGGTGNGGTGSGGTCSCSSNYVPVCGVDGITYTNACVAACQNVRVVSSVACSSGAAGSNDAGTSNACNCPVTTGAQVCGADGHTYNNTCEAGCAHASVQYYGSCATSTGGSNGIPPPAGCSCPSTGPQVCGSDGHTYTNACRAACLHLAVKTTGPCPPVAHPGGTTGPTPGTGLPSGTGPKPGNTPGAAGRPDAGTPRPDAGTPRPTGTPDGGVQKGECNPEIDLRDFCRDSGKICDPITRRCQSPDAVDCIMVDCSGGQSNSGYVCNTSSMTCAGPGRCYTASDCPGNAPCVGVQDDGTPGKCAGSSGGVTVDAGTPPGAVISEGNACNSKLDDPNCEPGTFCDAVSKKCVVAATKAGDTCTPDSAGDRVCNGDYARTGYHCSRSKTFADGASFCVPGCTADNDWGDPDLDCPLGQKCETGPTGDSACVDRGYDSSGTGGPNQRCKTDDTCDNNAEGYAQSCGLDRLCHSADTVGIYGKQCLFDRSCYNVDPKNPDLECSRETDTCILKVAQGKTGLGCHEDFSCDVGKCGADGICHSDGSVGVAGMPCIQDAVESYSCSAKDFVCGDDLLCHSAAEVGGVGRQCQRDGTCNSGNACAQKLDADGYYSYICNVDKEVGHAEQWCFWADGSAQCNEGICGTDSRCGATTTAPGAPEAGSIPNGSACYTVKDDWGDWYDSTKCQSGNCDDTTMKCAPVATNSNEPADGSIADGQPCFTVSSDDWGDWYNESKCQSGSCDAGGRCARPGANSGNACEGITLNCADARATQQATGSGCGCICPDGTQMNDVTDPKGCGGNGSGNNFAGPCSEGSVPDPATGLCPDGGLAFTCADGYPPDPTTGLCPEDNPA